MDFTVDGRPEEYSLRSLLLDIAQERSSEKLLGMVVRQLASEPYIGFVGIWLTRPSDFGLVLEDGNEEEIKTCLHLIISAEMSLGEMGEDWSRIEVEGNHPLMGVQLMGRAATMKESLFIEDVRKEFMWTPLAGWVQRRGIVSFEALPILYKGEVIGVMGLFYRMKHDGREYHRLIVDHLAIALANSRAYQDVERKRDLLELETGYLREEVRDSWTMGGIVGQSDSLRTMVRQIDLVAPTENAVLIVGETGTGKERIARAIHQKSLRRNGAMIRVHCSSIPEELFEGELFGHAKDAFPETVKERAGRVDAAHKGTLFLEGIAVMPLEMQSRILRVMKEGKFERMGEHKTRRVNVRFLASTARDLEKEVREGRFLRELKDYLDSFVIDVDPLRNRKEDILPLADHMMHISAVRYHCQPPILNQEQKELLKQYDWPGNVRELHTVMERAVITQRGGHAFIDLEPRHTRTAELLQDDQVRC